MASRGTVTINPNSPYWINPVERQKFNFEKGHLSSAHPMHAIHHEIGHLKYNAPWYFSSREEREIAKKGVGAYAAENPREFVSEVYAGMKAGRAFNPEVQHLFSRYAILRVKDNVFDARGVDDFDGDEIGKFDISGGVS
jgi:hypothetical protein